MIINRCQNETPIFVIRRLIYSDPEKLHHSIQFSALKLIFRLLDIIIAERNPIMVPTMRKCDIDKTNLRKLTGNAHENISADRSRNPAEEHQHSKKNRDAMPDQLKMNLSSPFAIRSRFCSSDFYPSPKTEANDRAFDHL